MRKFYAIPTQVKFRDPYFEMDNPDSPEGEKGKFIGGIAFGEYVIDATDGWIFRLDSYDFEALEFEELDWIDISEEILGN